MAWGVNNTGWWGEGEIKFFMDGDGEFPTICGTGTEDYFCGSYNFDVGKDDQQLPEFTTPYAGLPQVHPARRHSTSRSSASACTAGTSSTRSASSRTCKVTIQALGWRTEGGALPAAAGRHRLGRLLVPDAADGAVPAAARPDYLEVI